MNVEAVKRACALVRTGKGRGTAYLIAPEWAVTCAHVVKEATRAVLEFPWGQVYGDVHCERDEARDVALIKLATPAEGIRPLRLTRVAPHADAECWTYGFPMQAGDTGLRFVGSVRDANAHDDKGAAAIALSLTDPMSGESIAGFSGGPVLMGSTVVGHLRRVLGDGGKPTFGQVFACPVDNVLALVPSQVRAMLSLLDIGEFLAKMRTLVEALLAADNGAFDALATDAGLPRGCTVADVSAHLFGLDCVRMSKLCQRAAARLRRRGADTDRISADRISDVALAALPAQYELGYVRFHPDAQGAVLVVEAADEFGVEVAMARHRGGHVQLSPDRTRLRGRGQLSVDRIELGSNADADRRLGLVRKQLAAAFGIASDSMADEDVDEWINTRLRFAASDEDYEGPAYYYLFTDEADLPFAKRLAETYSDLRIVSFRRFQPDESARYIHAAIVEYVASLVRLRRTELA